MFGKSSNRLWPKLPRSQTRNPAALGCRGWCTAKGATLGELDAAMTRAATGESASYIEVVAGPLDLPAALAMAHQRLDALWS